MKTIIATVLSLLITATQVLAIGSTRGNEGPGLLAALIIVFGILITLLQFLPGLLLFGGVVKDIFFSSEK